MKCPKRYYRQGLCPRLSLGVCNVPGGDCMQLQSASLKRKPLRQPKGIRCMSLEIHAFACRQSIHCESVSRVFVSFSSLSHQNKFHAKEKTLAFFFHPSVFCREKQESFFLSPCSLFRGETAHALGAWTPVTNQRIFLGEALLGLFRLQNWRGGLFTPRGFEIWRQSLGF